jgi:hypothetical protein
MAERLVKVKVVRGGREIEEIERPLRLVDGRNAVMYKRKLWEVLRGNLIRIDGSPLREKGNSPESPPVVQVRTGRNASIGSDASGANPGLPAAEPVSGVAEPAAPAYAVEIQAGEPDLIVPEKWDQQQIDVIEAPAEARLLVDAGPGTGKTAVACRRVAWLIDECAVTPSNVWLVSFTRTAVKELRNRICHYLREPADVFSIKVATIDSHAWAIHSGFDAHASLTGSYEQNIEQVTELIRQNEGVFEYLAEVEHLIVDEAQDIVGQRADLMMELLRRLSSDCGVTVFADEAQAIYGFASDEDDHSTRPAGHLPERLRGHGDLGFQETALTAIYRTNREHLVRLFTEVRTAVRTPTKDGDNGRLERVQNMVRALADGENAKTDAINGQDQEILSRTFVLYRRRVDALTAASLWGTAPHRLRMSGLPVLVEPWLGAMFWDRTEKQLKLADFERLWAERVDGRGLSALTMQGAWELLVKTAGESRTVVSTQLLRSKLGRSAPPSDFVRADFGLGGPVFGTIHGCKGREADCVLLMLPASTREESDVDEEARVVFVGATRARTELRIGGGYKYLKSRRLAGSGRVYALKTKSDKAAAQVEFGRAGDLSAEGVAGRGLFGSAESVIAAQCWLVDNANRIMPASARAVAELDWRYRIDPKEGPPMAYLADRIGRELFAIGDDVQEDLSLRRKLHPSGGPHHLKIFGACTLVLHPDDPCRDLLHEPWATSGFVLAPVVQGFDMVYFR